MTTDQRGWRVGHQGRDQMYYEELRDGSWERIDIDGEMLMGPAHHVIYFAAPERWRAYPAWARERRDEIIARITSEFREPDYEYSGLAAASAVPDSTEAKPAAPTLTPKRRPPPQGYNALIGGVLVMFLIAAVMGWLVTTGVSRGETRLPLKLASLRRPVARAQEPAMFWTSIGIYFGIGAGTLVLGALGVREARRLRG
jgi:hypothetical protein